MTWESLRWSGAGGLYPVTKVNHVYPSKSDRNQLRLFQAPQSVEGSLEPIIQAVDILLINKSCETSINIKSHVDYIVVHSSQDDVQTQAVGRYRNDIDLVYLYNPYIWDDIILPNEMLKIPLYKEDVDSYIEELDIRDEHGHIKKQPTFLKHITIWDYVVQAKKKKGGKRYHIISKITAGTKN